MASSEKRCLYEILGIGRDSTADEIRSAYRKLALQRHPDKLVKSGVSEAEATASFQELVNAYEVLSDPRERAWYDSHRSQILFSNSSPSGSSNSFFSTVVPNLFSFFSNSVFFGYSDTGKGFYKVYCDLFDKIYNNELNFAKKLGLGLPREAPVMGNLQSPYAQVSAFYNYWLGFATIMDFCWVDEYDAMAGPNRKSRRMMEEENKKLRKKAKREYNETVRGLAEFVKKRDKRVIDMQIKRNEELEKKRAEEVERKKKMEREREERLRAYEEPEWAKVEEIDDAEVEVLEENHTKHGAQKELYCVACGKKFKSEKQWKNHEQSKKHKERVAELREAFLEEEGKVEKDEDVLEGEVFGDDMDSNSLMSADDAIDELQERFQSSFDIKEQVVDSDVESNEDSVETDKCGMRIDEDGVLDDDETNILEAMISGHTIRRDSMPMNKAKVSANKDFVEADDMDFMDYNDTKGAGRRKGGRRGKGKKNKAVKVEVSEGREASANNGYDDSSQVKRSSSHSSPENENNENGGDPLEQDCKFSEEPVDKRRNKNKERNVKSKNAPKVLKQKAASKSHGNVCETCTEEFDSRNQLHKHLNETGHASLKYR